MEKITNPTASEVRHQGGKKWFHRILGMGFALGIALPGLAGAANQAPVNLRSAADYGVLAGWIVTNLGSSTINGDVGIKSSIDIVASPDPTVNGALHKGDAAAEQAVADLATAYDDAAGRTGAVDISGNIGGQTLTAGIYKSTGDLDIKSGNLTLDGQGNGAAVFIFQVAGDLGMESCAVSLTGGARACNVFWQVGGSAKIGLLSTFTGTILANDWITLCIAATVDGRLLALHGGVALVANTVTPPGVCSNGRAHGDFDNSGCTDVNDHLFLLDNWTLEIGDGLGPIGIQDFLNMMDYWLTGPTCGA